MPIPNPFQYQYQPQDDPLKVAEQFNVTPQQLLAANPGGTPFSTGQTIKIPQALQAVMQYEVPKPSLTPNWQDRAALGVANGYEPQSYLNIIKRLGRGEDVNLSPDQRQFIEGVFTTPAARAAQAEATGQTPGVVDPTKPYGGFTNNDPGNTDYANTKSAQYYAAAGTPFLQQKRWDPQAKKYVSIGKLLKQGKLDLQGNWHRRSKRQKMNDSINRKNQQAQAAQDYTLANSLINFSTSSG